MWIEWRAGQLSAAMTAPYDDFALTALRRQVTPAWPGGPPHPPTFYTPPKPTSHHQHTPPSVHPPAQTMLLSSWLRGIQRLQFEMESSPTSMRLRASGPDCQSAPHPSVLSGVPLGTAGSGVPAEQPQQTWQHDVGKATVRARAGRRWPWMWAGRFAWWKATVSQGHCHRQNGSLCLCPCTSGSPAQAHLVAA